MKDILSFIVKSLVEDQKAVKIEEVNENEKTIVVTATVADADMGKVIGKNGKIASAIRTIVKTASAKSGKRYIIKFNSNK